MRSGTKLIGCVGMVMMVALAMGASVALGGPIQYTLNELPEGFWATGMSGNGYLIGMDANTQQGALYRDGTVTYLDHTPSGNWLNDRTVAVNNTGQVAWRSDGIIAMNNSGQFVGDHNVMGYSPYLKNADGSEVSIPSPVSSAPVAAWGINDAGAVVGWMGASGGGHPFLYQNGQSIDLGLLPGAQGATAFDINNAGQVVGGVQGNYTHPFLWDSGKLYDLGTLGGIQGAALSINDEGQIVGWSATPDSGHAFLYESGRMLDLNDLISPVDGLTLTQAIAIDDRGEILVEGYKDGYSREYLLTPSATVVPEPSSLVIFLTSLTLLATTRFATRTLRGNHEKARTPQPASHRDGP